MNYLLGLKEKDICLIIGILLLAIISVYLAFELEAVKRTAIRKGFAEFVITDPATGITEWRWKEVEE